MTSLATDFQNRLVPLCDGRPGLRGSLHVDILAPHAAGSSPSPWGEGRGEGEPRHATPPGQGEGEPPPNMLGSPRPSDGRGARGEGQSNNPSTLDFISSDGTLDRYREIITPAGWQLAAYQRNPVFQNSHQYGDIIFTLGKALITEIRPGNPSAPHSALRTPHLFQRIQFATDANPMARIAYGLYRGKFLNAVSVGFIPIRWEDADGNEHSTRSHAPTLSRSDASSLRTPNSPSSTACH